MAKWTTRWRVCTTSTATRSKTGSKRCPTTSGSTTSGLTAGAMIRHMLNYDARGYGFREYLLSHDLPVAENKKKTSSDTQFSSKDEEAMAYLRAMGHYK